MDGAEETVPLWPDAAPGARGSAEADRPALTVYPAAGGGPHGAVIVCPGGGYGMLAPHEGAPVARWLATLGIRAFVLRYRVAPYRHPRPLEDLQRAIRTVRHRAREWAVLPARVGILGFSAGGHLCATAATLCAGGDPSAADPVERQSCRPDAAVLCYPLISLVAPYTHRGAVSNLVGDGAPADLLARLSPDQQVRADSPPAFVWITADDDAVSPLHCLSLCAAYTAKGVPYELHVYAHGRHGLGLAEGDPVVGTWTGHCAAWLRRQGIA